MCLATMFFDCCFDLCNMAHKECFISSVVSEWGVKVFFLQSILWINVLTTGEPAGCFR